MSKTVNGVTTPVCSTAARGPCTAPAGRQPEWRDTSKYSGDAPSSARCGSPSGCRCQFMRCSSLVAEISRALKLPSLGRKFASRNLHQQADGCSVTRRRRRTPTQDLPARAHLDP
jgi:hypothetical protein